MSASSEGARGLSWAQEANLPTRLARMQKKQRDLGAAPQECLKASEFVSKAAKQPFNAGSSIIRMQPLKVICPVERRITTYECQLEDFFEGLDFSRLQARALEPGVRCGSKTKGASDFSPSFCLGASSCRKWCHHTSPSARARLMPPTLTISQLRNFHLQRPAMTSVCNNNQKPTCQDVTCMDPNLDWPLYEDDAEAARARGWDAPEGNTYMVRFGFCGPRVAPESSGDAGRVR